MIKKDNCDQTEIAFEMPFGQLNPRNRWVTLSHIVPWEELCCLYEKSMNPTQGAGSVPSRVAVGALLLKHLTNQSDEEIIESIRENPYFQYFLGYRSFSDRQVFTPSLFVTIRRRLGSADIAEVTRLLNRHHKPQGEKGSVTDRGTLIVDATVSPADISYPTDSELLNQAREISEGLLDNLWDMRPNETEKKPRTYRRQARKEYLAFTRKRKKGVSVVRHFIRKQLGYLDRNIRHIYRLLDAVEAKCFPLPYKDQKKLWIITELLRQQREMYDNKKHQTPGRIVSLSQPHVRPIVRGKSGRPVEFGAKLSVSYVKGLVYLDRLDWENFNESTELKGQIESYRKRHGHYPEWVLGDKIYWTRANRDLCKSLDIKIGGAPPLGRPTKSSEGKAERARSKKKSAERNRIEGSFGVGKRAYTLGRIFAKTRSTSENWIAMVLLVMNLAQVLRDHFLSLFFGLYIAIRDKVIHQFSFVDEMHRTGFMKSQYLAA